MDRGSAARFLALGGIWGSSFLWIKIALEGLAPAEIVLGRLACGAIVLAVAVVMGRRGWPTGGAAWRHLGVIAIVGNVVPFFLFAWGEQHVGSSIAGVLNGATPLLTMVVALALLPEERATVVRVVGLVVGFAGVVVILAPWRPGAAEGALSGKLACLAAAGCYAVSFSYTRRFIAGRGFGGSASLAAAQLVMATGVAAVVAPVASTHGPHLTTAVALALLALGAGGTGTAYLLYYGLIEKVGATTASMVTYVIPVVAVALGVLVRGEPLTANVGLGAVVVIAGVAIAEGRWARTVPAVSSP